jgi:hypothetical protein
VIVPLPSPVGTTVIVSRATTNVAPTVVAAAMVSVQVGAAPLQAPVHVLKAAAAPGVAVSVTIAPRSNVATQVAPHWMPAGLEATAPSPVVVTVSVPVVGASGWDSTEPQAGTASSTIAARTLS